MLVAPNCHKEHETKKKGCIALLAEKNVPTENDKVKLSVKVLISRGILTISSPVLSIKILFYNVGYIVYRVKF